MIPDCCEDNNTEFILFGTFILENRYLYMGFMKDKKPIGWGAKIGFVIESFLEYGDKFKYLI